MSSFAARPIGVVTCGDSVFDGLLLGVGVANGIGGWFVRGWREHRRRVGRIAGGGCSAWPVPAPKPVVRASGVANRGQRGLYQCHDARWYDSHRRVGHRDASPW